MSYEYKAALIRDLEAELDAARKIDVKDIAARIREIGFQCLVCGRCCRREYGDNTVIVSPDEIEKVQNNTEFIAEHIATPIIEEKAQEMSYKDYLMNMADSMDINGYVHTFGWNLCQKKNGDCRFIQDKDEGNRCTIYPVRPMLCSTYPFYMEDMELKVSYCEGLGRNISDEESIELAENVLERYIAEIEDTIRLYERYEEFERSREGIDRAQENLGNGYINYIVHDSRGKHSFKLEVDI